MHIRTDDEVYRVDAVWLGPPRATFPWRARYSAYGVGLLVMIVIMFLQRRLGVPLGFFSVAWALLITVLITRFVSRRINDERPLLEWLTLFVHELRGPRARTRSVGGALTTEHVRVHRDRPHPVGRPVTLALPPGGGASAADGARVARSDGEAAVAGPVTPRGRGGATPAMPVKAAARPTPPRSRRGRRADAGWGSPTATEIGEPVRRQPRSTSGDAPVAALPAAPRPEQSAAAVVASWTPQERAPQERAPQAATAPEAGDADGGPYPAQPVRSRGGARFTGAFGPGVRRTGATDDGEGSGARP